MTDTGRHTTADTTEDTTADTRRDTTADTRVDADQDTDQDAGKSPERQIETDFCVVGGGPAGLTLALVLLRSGARVTLVERASSFDREYRGEILQPGGTALLDSLGVLAGARERGSHEHDRFQLVDRGRVLLDGDYRRLPGPHNHLLAIPQPHLLQELLEHCLRHDRFTYLGGTRVTGLLEEDGAVRGALCEGRGGRHAIVAHCVVGADGRYSKVRRLAGIGYTRLDVFDQDVLWFKLPAAGAPPRVVRVFLDGGNPVLTYASVPDGVQVGWTLPHKGYAALAAEGVDHVKRQICAAIPEYADLVRERIGALTDLTLLDVFAGGADRWVRDGLVLIGDSAHTHGPIGAQGINLAIQDAVAVHPILLASLRSHDARASFLGAFTLRRRPSVDSMTRIQRAQSRVMLSTGGFASMVRPALARVVSRSPVYRSMLKKIAYGDPGLRVSAELFVPGAASPASPA
ncbi:FAD-dependent monooxygenase [Sphaerisporangium sp. NPDC005289]|uniref:FAD-dependent monooxygenase n=1 Tax=Sphaerisporangium sp. NPDC005289 TaxID=3155247 RepID=UPI0033AFCE0A